MYRYTVHADIGDGVGQFLVLNLPSQLLPTALVDNLRYLDGRLLDRDSIVSIHVQEYGSNLYELWYPPGCPVENSCPIAWDTWDSQEEV